jgi:hypothetical protein
MTIDQVCTLLGWSIAINSTMLLLTALLLMRGQDTLIKLHRRFFSIDPDQLTALYLNFLSNYKLAMIMFNITPYLALKIMM